MISLLQDLARDYQAVVVGFGQVFLASGLLVAIAYGLKSLLLPKRAKIVSDRPRQRKAARIQVAPLTVLAEQRALAPVAFDPSDRATSGFLSPEAHWQRATAPVRLTIERGERARELHERALVRLEAADYALRRLLLDLAGVISLPQNTEASQPLPAVSATAQEHRARLAA